MINLATLLRQGREMGRVLVLLMMVLLLPLLVSAWREATGQTINPRLVQRLQNGVTTKHEVLLYFGEPQEVVRTPEGPIFKYASYKDAAPLPWTEEKQPGMTDERRTAHPFYLDGDKKIKSVAKPKEGGKVLRSTLDIRFKPDGETVISYEYKEY